MMEDDIQRIIDNVWAAAGGVLVATLGSVHPRISQQALGEITEAFLNGRESVRETLEFYDR